MWAPLSDPVHLDRFAHLGEAYAPVRRLVEDLGRRDYAGRVYAFNANGSLKLTTAPKADAAARHDGIGITYDPKQKAFAVGYSTPAQSPTPSRGYPTIGNRVCAPSEVSEVIDQYVQGMLQPRPQSIADKPLVQSAIVVTTFAVIFASLIFWTLMWFDLPVGRLMLMSAGLLGTAAGMSMIGGAVVPHWRRAAWAPPPGHKASVEWGRFVCFVSGIWFTGIGVIFIRGGIHGDMEIPSPAVWVLLATLATAFVLALISFRFDRRRAERALGIEDTAKSGRKSSIATTR
jgi:hypothetical protein